MAGPAALTFEDLATLDDRSLQIILRQLDRPTLVAALREATPAVVDAVFRNVSQRAGQQLREDIAIVAGDDAAQRAAEARQVIGSVLTTVYARQAVQEHDTGKPRPSLLTDHLAADPGSASAAGPAPAAERPPPVVAPPPAAAPAATPPPPLPPPATLVRPPPPLAPAPPRLDATAPTSPPPANVVAAKRRSPWVRDPAAVGARLADWLVLVRQKGTLALDAQEAEIEASSGLGRHLRLGVELVVDEEKPEKVQERLDAHAEEEAAALMAALDLLTEGLIAIQAGVAPDELARRVGLALTPRDTARLARTADEPAEPDAWLDDPVAAIGVMTAWCRIAHRSGPVALDAAAGEVDASTDLGEHARIGLLLVVEGQDPALVRDVLDTNRDAVVAAFRQSAAMVDAGLWYIQHELPPGAATDALAVFLAPHDRARFRTLAAQSRRR